MWTLAYYLLTGRTALGKRRGAIARQYPEHITVKGRFGVAPADCERLIDLGKATLSGLLSLKVELRGPHSPGQNLVWYEVADGSAELDRIRAAHVALRQSLQGEGILMKDLVDSRYEGNGFRPHFTVCLRERQDTGVASAWPDKVRTRIVAWGIYRYAGTEPNLDLRPVHLELA